MLVKIIISVTIASTWAQRMPLMPPSGTAAGKQDTVSFSELIAMMAMRNQLPTGDQSYSLLNLTDGNTLPNVPPKPSYPLKTQPKMPPKTPAPSPVQQRPQIVPKKPSQQERQVVNRVPQQPQVRPTVPQITPAYIQSAVNSAVNAALPLAVKAAVKSAVPPAQPQMSQADIQAAVQSAINAVLPSAVEAAVKASVAPPTQSNPAMSPANPAMSPAAIQSAINLAVKAAVAANPAVKATTPAPAMDIQSMINAAMKKALAGAGAVASKPKPSGPPPPCSGTCPPKWLATVKGFTGIMKAGDAMCKFTKFMTPCDTPNAECKKGYSCCPVSCLDTIVGCHTGAPIESACLPDDITPWWPEMVQTYMATYGMGGAGMGGAMGGPMGGPMAGMMGGMGAMLGF